MAGNAGAFRLRGYNDFYDGWLARVLHRPRKETENDLWKDGWDMANETGDAGIGEAFVEEMRRTSIGLPAYTPHIILDEVADV